MDVPPGGKATDRLAINVFGAELGFLKTFCEFVHHRNDGQHPPLDARVYIDGKMDRRVGYRAGQVVFDAPIGEGAQATVTIGDRTLTLTHDPDLPQEARVRVVIT